MSEATQPIPAELPHRNHGRFSDHYRGLIEGEGNFTGWHFSDDGGNHYAGSLNHNPEDPFNNPNGIGVYRTTPQTLTSCTGGTDPVYWPTRRAVNEPGHFLDKEWIHVGRSGSGMSVKTLLSIAVFSASLPILAACGENSTNARPTVEQTTVLVTSEGTSAEPVSNEETSGPRLPERCLDKLPGPKPEYCDEVPEHARAPAY